MCRNKHRFRGIWQLIDGRRHPAERELVKTDKMIS
jgi:hypothetical protein